MISLTSYKKDYDSKLDESKQMNDINSKDIKDKAKAKEYEYPPLPNLVNAKLAYFTNRQSQNYSVIVPGGAKNLEDYG
jgi:hypothetical protein